MSYKIVRMYFNTDIPSRTIGRGLIVRWGDVQYDQSHAPLCGASSVPGGNRRFRSEDVARDLLEQCREQAAE